MGDQRGQCCRRTAILELLRGCELSAGEIASRLGTKRPALSHHLSVLLREGLLVCRAEGAFRFYSLRDDPTRRSQETAPMDTMPAKTEPDTPFVAAIRRLASERGIADRFKP